MKKSHRVAHEKSEAWWVLLLSLYNFYCGCQDSFSKKEYKLPLFLTVHTCYTKCNRYVLYCQLSINQFVQHNFLCTIMDTSHSLNPFPLIVFFHFLSYRLSFLRLTDDDLQSVLRLLIYIRKISPELATQYQIIKQHRIILP